MPRNWLTDDLTHTYLPAIGRLKDSPQGRKQAENLVKKMRDNWAQQGLASLKQQQGCMDQVRRAIKDEMGEDHWTLDIIRFSREDYVELNNLKQASVAKRNEAVQQIDDPDQITAIAVRLLESPEWADMAAGLCVLTGRRVSELLATAQFTPKTRWSVVFSGAVKRGTETDLSFEIPTLTTAERVCDALAKIRRELPQAREMSVSDLNKTFEPAVARSCNKHFEGVVPVREGKETLYSHLFRAVYATIATFWYCPSHVNETEYRAAIQGHFQILDEKNPELRRSLAASRHYADYEISDSVIARHRGKRKGVKLGHGGIEAIEMFKQAEKPKSMTKTRKKPPSSVRIWKEDKAILMKLFTRLGLTGDGKQEDRMRDLLAWIDAKLPELQQQKTLETPEEVPTARDPLREDLRELITTLKEAIPAMMQRNTVAQPEKQPKEQLQTPTPVSTQSKEQQQEERKKNLRKAETTRRVNQAIDAIMAYNNAPERTHDEKWAVTINGLKSWISSAPTIMSVLEERKSELEEHFQTHGIDPEKHNLRHRRKAKIDEVIHPQFDEEYPS